MSEYDDLGVVKGSSDCIEIVGGRENNLKNINIKIPKNLFVVVTGPSGAGKSSLAFGTIYAEGQARYVESLSPYARQFLNLQNKPNVDYISGLSPAIAIEQKTINKNPRSTVATVTEVYDYVRLLFSKIGIPYSPKTNKPIESQSVSQMTAILLKIPHGSKVHILAPFVKDKKGVTNSDFIEIKKRGFNKVRINGVVYSIDDLPKIGKDVSVSMEIVVDRLIMAPDMESRLSHSLEIALSLSNGIIYAMIVKLPEDYNDESDDEEYKEGNLIMLSSKFSCPVSGFFIEDVEPRIFSFNTPHGACPKCGGLGKEMALDINLVIPNPYISIAEGAIHPWDYSQQKSSISRYYMQVLQSLAKHYEFKLETPWHKLPNNIQQIILYGSGGEKVAMTYEEDRVVHSVKKVFIGVIPFINKSVSAVDNISNTMLSRYQSMKFCSQCNGYRLKRESLCVKINNFHIGQVTDMTVAESLKWFGELRGKISKTHLKIAEVPLQEITRRLNFLLHVGLDYLCLNRESHTLSGGESQRIRLASQIGSGLSGVIYVLDEPSIGLHQRDNYRLLQTIKYLRDVGNTVIVVEHDEDTMLNADHIIDVGPEAGENGGYIIAQGTPKDVMNNPDSVTGKYLSKKTSIAIPKKRPDAKGQKYLELIGAKSNNLKNVSVKFPLGKFICVTGVSGSGKSTLIMKTLCPALARDINKSSAKPNKYQVINGIEYINKVIEIDQSPIGRTPLSNAATYTGVFKTIRDLFASLPESKLRGYTPGRFSFNTKGGRCEACSGDGVIKIEMHFLPDVYVKCDQCNGKRYNTETLEVLYKGKSISDVLDMTTDEATDFFKNVPIILEKMKSMQEVGLGYINIGLSATVLSGGEAQRIKLSKELSRKSTGKTLYILDEPTTGLHTSDVRNLLQVLHKLVDAGNTVIVIEHNLELIKTADYVIDVGPEGGDKGGEIVFSGAPEDLCKSPESITGEFLNKVMNPEFASSDVE